MNQETVQTLFVYKDGSLYRRATGKRVGSPNNEQYEQVEYQGHKYKIHRLVFLYFNGWVPPIIDHIDQNRRNNSIENLRPATKTQNIANSSKSRGHTSPFKGVCLRPNGKWWAQIRENKKFKHLGYFSTEIEAAQAYNDAALKIHGEHAWLNVI